jgi:Uncharacterized protein conserved in bacteria
MVSESLLDANLAVFETHFPSLHARLKAGGSPLSSLMFDRGEAVDINLGSGRLYRTDGRILAPAQVEAFMRAPVQAGYLLPDHNTFDSLLSRRVHQQLLDSASRHDAGELRSMNEGESGYFFIFGVGLGYHLPLLLERIKTPHVVICEAFEEFLLASLQVIDWGMLVDSCRKRGVTLHVVCSRAAEDIVRQVIHVIDKNGPFFLDGSYFFKHYPLWAFEEAERRLINELPRQMMARGFFEDERKMVRNAVTNFQKYDVHVLTGGFRPRSHVPVFVIGAGPSLDACIPYIKEWREHAIVFSAGSGLQPCLKNGIIPDFHVELENTHHIVGKLKFILEQHPDLFPNGKFEGIRLVGSATLNPQVPPLFSDLFLFMRDSSTPSLSFGAEFGVHTGAGPTVANTSISTLARMGLGDVYLFGVDCGWRDQFNHHARDTIYYTSAHFRNDKMSGTYTLPGNFGGEIQSDIIFDWCRDILEQSFAAFHLTVYNCSDGALLKGATPRVAEALHFNGDPLDREAIVREIIADRPQFAAGAFFRTRPLSAYQPQLDGYETEFMTLLDTAVDEDWTFHAFLVAFWRGLGGEAADRGLGMAGWVQCSTIGMLKAASIVMNRIPIREKRQAVTRDHYAALRQVHAEMFAEARQHLEQIDAWAQGGPEPEWTDGLPRVPGTTY